MKFKAYNIYWDTFDEDLCKEVNPEEYNLPNVVIGEDEDIREDMMEDEIADIICEYLSNEYAFLVNSFNYEILK